MNEPLTVGKLRKWLDDNKVPDDVHINVLNKDGELSANIELHYENLETRQYVHLWGLQPFWKKENKEIN